MFRQHFFVFYFYKFTELAFQFDNAFDKQEKKAVATTVRIFDVVYFSLLCRAFCCDTVFLNIKFKCNNITKHLN